MYHLTSRNPTGETCMQRNATRCYMAIYIHIKRKIHYKVVQGIRKTAVQSSSCKIKIQAVLLYAILPHTPRLFLLKIEIFLSEKNHLILTTRQFRQFFFRGLNWHVCTTSPLPQQTCQHLIDINRDI